MTTNEQTIIALNIALFLQLSGMIFALIIDPYIGKRNKNIMLISAVLAMSLIIQQYAETYFHENSMTLTRMIAAVYGYSVRPAIICMFMQLFDRNKKNMDTCCDKRSNLFHRVFLRYRVQIQQRPRTGILCVGRSVSAVTS